MTDRDVRLQLQQFFGGYFNQDWDAGGATSWAAVVDEYVSDNSVAHVAATRDALRSWLAETSADEGLPFEFGCDYDPLPDGMDERTWLHALARYLDEKIVRW